MTIKKIHSAESWDKIYQAFEDVSFVSYDYDAIKDSLIEYLKHYYKEDFNDYIESSEFIALIESFAYVAEQIAYRVDMATHENTMDGAARKQSILRLAKLISYNATRNLPARGLTKLSSISTSERIIDSQGNNLANRVIFWNDPNNSLWKEQFFLIMNRILTKQFGQPTKSYQIDDVAFQLYSLGNTDTSFTDGVHRYSVSVSNETLPMEIVSCDIDENGPFEKYVDAAVNLQLLYSNDGLGDGSDMSGFLMYTKQGKLYKYDYDFDIPLPNRSVEINVPNINDVDIWVNKVDENGDTSKRWEKVGNINAENIHYNLIKERDKFEVETLENDKVRVIFGDGDFSNIPVGKFQVWFRASSNKNIIVQKNKVVDESMEFSYRSGFDVDETATLTFSLVSTLQNASVSEDIEHIRRTAPTTFYSQGRMVNGQDYNTLLLKDPSILRLKAINRTFAGQPKHVEWNDASGNYQNVKVFGDDLRIYHDLTPDIITTTLSTRVLIDKVIEPLLSTPGLINMMTYVGAIETESAGYPDVIRNVRTTFVERSYVAPTPPFSILEKSEIQGLLDRHFYGEPISYKTESDILYGIIMSDEADQKVYDPELELYNEDSNAYIGISGTPAASDQPSFGIRYESLRAANGNGFTFELDAINALTSETWTIECINEENNGGTFTVTGSVSGQIEGSQTARVGEDFDNGIIQFSITQDDPLPADPRNFVSGDSYIVRTTLGTPVTTVPYDYMNLSGRWQIISGDDLGALDFDLTNAGNTGGIGLDDSWLIKIDKQEDIEGNILSVDVSSRNLHTVVESTTTKFWYNSSQYIIDSDTKKRLSDKIQILKSNLRKDGMFALGVNQVYDVAGEIRDSAGANNLNALEVLPTDSSGVALSGDDRPDNPLQFHQFVNVVGADRDYVYFRRNEDTLIPVTATNEIESFPWDTVDPNDDGPAEYNDGVNTYFRKYGRDGLDFLWQHFSPNSNLIDPSTSNIIDIFVLTRGYYDNVSSYISGTNPYFPTPPTPLELRNTYRDMLESKMLSDTVVLHSGSVKLLFGDLASPQLRSKFRIIKAGTSTLADDQIRVEVLDVINQFFAIDDWDFGDTFYATELFSRIHQALPGDIASVVIVPTFVDNNFGSMFVVESAEDEVLQSTANIKDIEIVDGFNSVTLKQCK